MKWMTPSNVYLQIPMIFVTKDSQYYASPLSRHLAPFQKGVWILMLMLLTCVIVIIFLTKKLSVEQRNCIIGGRLNRTPILNLINVLLGDPIANQQIKQNRQSVARILMISWIFFCLILRSSYQCALYDYFTEQKEPSPYDTVAKIGYSDCNINSPYSG